MFEDRQLINRVKNGDKKALCRIYRKYGDSLLAMAAGIVRDRAMAEDILHDVFLNFVRNIDCFIQAEKLKPYLARCVANRAIDILRSKNNHTVNIDGIRPVKTDTPLPHQVAAQNEELQNLEHALDQLPAEQRQVIMMHIHGQMGYRQIALCQNVSVNTIQGRYRYGMRKLRSLLMG